MELSSYVRLWLDNAQGARSGELRRYVEFLESEIERLKKEQAR